ncbi:MAG: oligopeptidase B, partial [Christiangramia sp.]|nr:oligopeptidase B [Christiangramia sp.]
MKRLLVFLLGCVTFATAQKKNDLKKDIQAPTAKKVAKELEKHGDVRIDNYFWMNQREDPEVIAYLQAENEYNEKMTSHTKEFQEELFEEMKGRIKEDDESVPYKLNGYWYITRFEKGFDYPIYSRKKESLDAPEEIMFNVNDMARDYEYYSLGGLNVSMDNKLVAFGTDTLSRRKYTIRIKNLETGEIYDEEIKNTTGGSTWANDNKTLYYTKKDPQTLRSYRIYKHILGTDPKEDEL